MRLRNSSGEDLDVSAPVSAVVKAGEEFDCPDEAAGTAPGAWREPTPEEAAEGLRGLVKRQTPDGRTEVLCPGSGLLSTGKFEAVAASAAAPKKTTANTQEV